MFNPKLTQMKTSAGTILLRYFGTIALISSLLGFGLYTSLRRNRTALRGISTCVTSTAVIALSMNKLAILLANPVMNEVPMKISGIQ
jgi:hypothetical protein